MSLYQLRPSPRQALYIYSNVGAALLVASSIEDVDFAEITTPLLSAAAPSLADHVPGLGGLSRLLGNSLANGAANAFLTLRVAMLTKQYCQALQQPDDPKPLRKSASLAALALLAVVSRDSGTRVVKAVFKGAGGALSDAASATGQNVMNSVSSGASAAGGQVRKVGQQLGRAFNASAAGARQLGDKMVRLGRKPVADETDDVP